MPRNSNAPQVYVRRIALTWKVLMSDSSTSASFEECADEMNEFVATLGRYPSAVLVFVLRAHLAGILQALMTHGGWTVAQATTFLEDMMRETLEPEES